MGIAKIDKQHATLVYGGYMKHLLDNPKPVYFVCNIAQIIGVISYVASVRQEIWWLNILGVILFTIAITVFYNWKIMAFKEGEAYKIYHHNIDRFVAKGMGVRFDKRNNSKKRKANSKK